MAPDQSQGPLAVALGARLCGCENVITLGVKPNFSDYTPNQARLIDEAPRIYYPSAFYADIFTALGKPVFPSISTYRVAQDKILQTALFQAGGLPHPRTRVYYGKRQQKEITEDFPFPFVAKQARGSSQGMGVFLIENPSGLQTYLQNTHTAYIQELVPGDRDLRVVVIGRRAVLSYWRVAGPGQFLTNVAQGGHRDFEDVPPSAVGLALDAALKCGLNDVGVDIRMGPDGPLILEANVKYGRRGFAQAGINYAKMMEGFIRDGSI